MHQISTTAAEVSPFSGRSITELRANTCGVTAVPYIYRQFQPYRRLILVCPGVVAGDNVRCCAFHGS